MSEMQQGGSTGTWSAVRLNGKMTFVLRSGEMAILSFDGGDGIASTNIQCVFVDARALAFMVRESRGLSARTAGMVRGLHNHGWGYENVTSPPPPGASVLAKVGWAVDHVARAGRIPRYQSGQWVSKPLEYIAIYKCYLRYC